MSRGEDIKAFSGQQIIVGLSTTVGVTVLAGQIAMNFKILGTGGTLWVHGLSQTPTNAYPLSANEVVSGNMAGKFYMSASGATTTVAVLFGRSAGDWEG